MLLGPNRDARALKKLGVAAAFMALTTPATANATGFNKPFAKFEPEKGFMTLPTYQGAGIPFELTVMPGKQDNCNAEMKTTISWNEQANKVKVRLQGKNVLDQNPTFVRTAGVNYFPNQFWPEPKDVINGRHQYWMISPGGTITLYYDPVTLDLLGSEWDFQTPPPAIPVTLPTIKVVSMTPFQPDANGDVDHTWEFDYDKIVKLDRPDQAHHLFTAAPENLCLANPFRFDLSTVRPFLTYGLPESEALNFREFLESGLIFDLTVEPAEYYTDPPLTTQIATYSTVALTGGVVPKGWSLDLAAVFGNQAPPIVPYPSRDTCDPYFYAAPKTNINWCAQMSGMPAMMSDNN